MDEVQTTTLIHTQSYLSTTWELIYFFFNACYQDNFVPDMATWEWWQDLSFHDIKNKQIPPKKNTNKKTLTKDNLPKNQTNHKNEPPEMERD